MTLPERAKAVDERVVAVRREVTAALASWSTAHC
jgi:hypothetical protein